MDIPSPISGEGGARRRSRWEGEGLGPTRKDLLARARFMRANPTEAEKRPWTMLRDRRLIAFKFRRQQIIMPYIVDFICLAQRLIIEADESQHADDKSDLRRDDFLRGRGLRVLRYWNNQVLAEADSVAEAIFAALPCPHPPKPSAWVPPVPGTLRVDRGPGTICGMLGASHTLTAPGTPSRGEGFGEKRG